MNEKEYDLDLVKSFLRIDFDDDDAVLSVMCEAAIEYIRNATGDYNPDSKLQTLLLTNIVTNMYENRDMTVSLELQNNYTIRSMIIQLQAEEYGDD